jgi:hypothetical protein
MAKDQLPIDSGEAFIAQLEQAVVAGDADFVDANLPRVENLIALYQNRTTGRPMLYVDSNVQDKGPIDWTVCCEGILPGTIRREFFYDENPSAGSSVVSAHGLPFHRRLRSEPA